MFYSQRVSNRKRRLVANPSAFNQSWRTRRPLSVECDIRDEARDAVYEAQSKKRSLRHAATTTVPQSSFDFRVENVVSEKRSPEIEDFNTLKAEEMPSVTKEYSVLVHFVHDLRSSLDDDDDDDKSMKDNEPAELPSKPKPNSIRSDSVIQTHLSRRKRRHSFHVPRRERQDLLKARADIKRMGEMRKMDRAEVSIRSEIHHQEKYLSSYKRDRGTPAYRRMVTALTQNRHHLFEYKRQKARQCAKSYGPDGKGE